ncbi:hypothetical protein L208DRAFT_1376144 [Tricholoma matsutake]|nr:hypothetical protein L208DRAFT_1376144 [Tricholoma matsutake 945]
MSQLLGKKHSGETKQEDVPHKDLQCIQPPMLQDDKPELSGSEGSGETIKGKEHNEDLQCVQPSALQDNDQSTPRSTVWKSFGDWLNLIMVHFDTINTLSHFVISRLPGGIHNVYASSTHHLGAASLGDAVTIKALPHQLVKKKRNSVPQIPLIGKKLVNHLGMADFDNIIKNMNRDLNKAVDSTNINAATLDIEAIASATEGLKENTNVASTVLEMTSSLNPLTPDSTFFSKLADSEKGKGSPGAEHCEALITILISLFCAGKPLPQLIQTSLASMKVDIEKAGLVIEVSEPCCLACWVLLELLKKALLHDNEIGYCPFYEHGIWGPTEAATCPIYVQLQINSKLYPILKFTQAFHRDTFKPRPLSQ